MRVHTRERPYQCPHCEKRFSQHGQLVIHIRRHTGEKPYVCTHCNKGFTCSKVLKIHVRTHTGEKPFQCEHCQKGFAAYANLVVHRRIHTRERPYACHLCGRAFEHSGNLSRHVRVHRVDSGVRCIPCGQVFSCDKELVNHTAQNHPNEYARDDDVDPEGPLPTEATTINLQDLEQFQPATGLQCVLPPPCESQLTILTPLEPPAPSEQIPTVPQPVEAEDEPPDTGVCITVSDSEDSGRESGGSTGYATSPDQAFDRGAHQSPETCTKVEEPATTTTESSLPVLMSSPVPQRDTVRETLSTPLPHEAPTPSPPFRMPPKKQQYPGGGRSPLSVLRAALSSQRSQPPTTTLPVASQAKPQHLPVISSPTIALPSEPILQPETSGPNSPHLDIHQLSLSHQSGSGGHMTPTGLGAGPFLRPYSTLPPGTEPQLANSPECISAPPLYMATSVSHSPSPVDSNPLDLSQPLGSHGHSRTATTESSPLNLSHRLGESPAESYPASYGAPHPPSSTHHLLAPTSLMPPHSHHLLTPALPSPPTHRSNILRRKSADVGYSDPKKHKSRKVAPPPLIPIHTTEKKAVSVSTTCHPPIPPISSPQPPQPEPQPQLASQQSSQQTIPVSSIPSFVPHQPCTTMNVSTHTTLTPPASIAVTPAHTRTITTLPTHVPSTLPTFPRWSVTLPPLRSKVEDTEIIVEANLPKDKFISHSGKPEVLLGGSCMSEAYLAAPSPLECIRENIQRSLLSLLPEEHEAAGFKRKVETALVVLVGEAPMRQLGYPEKTAEQVLITILDMAGKSPCADVRVDETQRLKVNMRKFLEYGFPSRTNWEELGWNGKSIETIMDNIISWISRRQSTDLKLFGGGQLGGGVGGMVGGGGGSVGDNDDFKVNGTPLKAL
ncbi:Zinc finger protein 664-like 1 [Homarus americanus]|uniref:Zinc finger protein 664-like 1 n=2 Tax=Homarus americanus TaxID=6706 RepID=A0A8J5JSZ6_HOMAM|nr:Zinc finger protein 664-like 1 [Homarus americanus]